VQPPRLILSSNRSEAILPISSLPVSSVPLGITGRRILWIVSVYRCGYALALLGSVLLPSTKLAGVTLPGFFMVGAALYFVVALGLMLASQMERELISLPWFLLLSIAGDTIFLTILIAAGGNALLPLSIFLFPQLAAHGWLLDRRTALIHTALPTLSFLSITIFLFFDQYADEGQLIGTALISASYFVIVFAASTVGRYTQVSERLMQQRNIDIANLEQINRVVIRDMKDGVLVLDLNGIVRGYNLQALSLLNVADYAAAGQRLAQWSAPLHDAWTLWQNDPEALQTSFAVEPTTSALLPRFVRIGVGISGGTLVYLEDLGRARTEAQNLKLAALGRLTASIAHEVRNPLSAIQQAAQLLEEDEMVPSEGLRLLNMIRNNGKRIDRIVTEVLQLNHRDRRKPEALRLQNTLQHLIDEIRAGEQMPDGAIVLDFTAPNDLTIDFDRGHFDQILWNLLRNAWQFCRKKTGSVAISVTLDSSRDRVRLDITDDGPGIAPEYREQAFEPFYTTRTSGTGLGLYIARELATANQAILELLPHTEGRGAHFRLRLARSPQAPT
jgi:two-component system sensor histidine kinase PilS (NtrC family)